MATAAHQIRRASVLIAGFGLLFAARPIAAQVGCGSPGQYHVRSAPSSLNYGPVTITDLDAGRIFAGTVTVSIIPRGRANFDWSLCLRGESPAFGPGGKPIGEVEWQLDGGAWQPMSAAEQLVASGTGRTDLDVMFRVAVDYDDAPGDYEALMTFAVARR